MIGVMTSWADPGQSSSVQPSLNPTSDDASVLTDGSRVRRVSS